MIAVGLRLFMPASYVNWCGHGQEVIPVPRTDGLVALIPVLGEATQSARPYSVSSRAGLGEMSYHRPAMSSLTFAYALLAALSLAAMAIGFKLASSGIHPVLGTAIVTGTAFLVNVVVALLFRTTVGPMAYSTSSALLLLLVGIATAAVNLFTLLAYTSGLKVTSSVMIGGVSTLLIMLVGFLVLKEPFSWTRLVAIGLIAGGVFMLQRIGV